jgi:hypothetical protein
LQNKSRAAGGNIEEVERKVFQTFKIKLNCSYSGRGMIIPVFGSGSYGVTTLAMSIARRIPRARVLYMDMNLVNPKADGWFKKSPIIASLDGIADQIKRSALGALIEKGSKYVIDNMDKVVQSGVETQLGTRVDYFSGIYTRVDNVKLSRVNFSEVLDHLGNMYDYIIADMGTVGSSEASDELMGMMNRISHKNILVTLNDSCDIRNINMKLGYIGIDLNKTIWVLNISDTTKVSDMFKHVASDIKPVVIPKDSNVQGKYIPLNRVAMLKDKIDGIVDNIR